MDITNRVVSSRDSAFLVGDHNAYRKKLSKRLLTLRKRLGRATPKREKFIPKDPITAEDVGKNHEFAYILLYTAERAWAHAMHLKATNSDDNASTGLPGPARSHIVSRLHKAASQARHLASILLNKTASGASSFDVLEARAYACYMAGAEEFEKHAGSQRSGNAQKQKQMWQKCIRCFSEARIIYSALFTSTKNDIFKEILAGTIDPSIRYAAYQSHMPRTLAIAAIARQHFPREDTELVAEIESIDPDAFADEAALAGEYDNSLNQLISMSWRANARKAKKGEIILDTVDWRGRTANISDASIGQALASVSVAEERLKAFLSTAPSDTPAKARAAAYDEVLIASQDAVDATRRAIEELEKEGVGQGDPRTQDLAIINLSVNYALVGWRSGRNRVLIGKDDGAQLENAFSKKPRRPRKDGKEWVEREEGNWRKLARLRERVVLYDATLQSIDSIKNVRGARRDAKFIEELDSKRAYVQALKCLNIAYSHGLLSNHRNALVLFARALELSSQSLSVSSTPSAPRNLASADIPTLEVSPGQLAALQNLCTNLVLRHRALVTLQNHKETSAAADAKNTTSAAPIVQRLHEYPTNGVDLNNLVTYPPKLEPVPVKPIFLDVAWNYIEYPGRSTKVVENGVRQGEATRIQQPQAEQNEQKDTRRGWFGFGRR